MTGPGRSSLTLIAGVLSTALAAFATPCVGQGPTANDPPDTRAFLERARLATSKYHDRSAAMADGYRPIGRDFPGMGEHWIHLGRLMSGEVVAQRPQILSYATIDGKPTLIGVAYAVPVAAGSEPPDYPVARDRWHFHSGTVAEESFLPHHAHESGDGSKYRVATVHAWIWLDNPDGTFATNNWALPFVRLGLEPPARFPPEAAKALSLLTGGDRYYADVAEACGDASESTGRAVAAELEKGRAAVSSWLRTVSANSSAGEIDLAPLAAVWNEASTSLARITGCTWMTGPSADSH